MKIIESRFWDMNDLRSACIRNDFYTCGNNEEYERLLLSIRKIEPSLENMQKVAEDILEHSEGQTLTNILWVLGNEVIRMSYRVYDDLGNELDV